MLSWLSAALHPSVPRTRCCGDFSRACRLWVRLPRLSAPLLCHPLAKCGCGVLEMGLVQTGVVLSVTITSCLEDFSMKNNVKCLNGSIEIFWIQNKTARIIDSNFIDAFYFLKNEAANTPHMTHLTQAAASTVFWSNGAGPVSPEYNGAWNLSTCSAKNKMMIIKIPYRMLVI